MLNRFIPILVLTLLLGLSLSRCGEQTRRPPAYSAAPPAPVRCGPQPSDRQWYDSDQKAPLFDDLGAFTFPVTTRKQLTQRYISQGLLLAYGFNHAEAARSFYYATQLEPDCAMAHWGFAYVLGPNYNAGMESDNYARAYEAAQRAHTLARQHGTPREQALTEALRTRYAREAPADRSALDEAYAAAMERVAENFPEDPDIGALFVEARMDLHPWDLWDKEGQPRPWTPEILAGLDRVLAYAPDHAGTNHLYIHAIEASHTPEKGLAHARRLDAGLAPGAGHLVHMPSHIYIRTGDYHEGSLANRRAVEVDSSYITACRAQGAYPLIYHPHNYHFLAATATLAGESEWAIDAAKRTGRHADLDLMNVPGLGMLQHFYTIPDYVLTKFGRWDDILGAIDTRRDLPYPKLIRHYARGMAYLGKGDAESARRELDQLRVRSAKANIDSLVIGVNGARAVASIAENVLAAELAARDGNRERAIELLREAVTVEDALNYTEPPDWFFSVRHHLGAVLVDAAKFAEAVAVYEEDLAVYPKNGWALSGLAAAYRGLGDTGKARETEARLAEAWKYADVELEGSRIKSPAK